MENVRQSYSTIIGKLETCISIGRMQAQFCKRKTSKNPALKKRLKESTKMLKVMLLEWWEAMGNSPPSFFQKMSSMLKQPNTIFPIWPWPPKNTKLPNLSNQMVRT